MKALQQTTATKITPTITAKQFEEKIKNWKEDTTTSPSGRHLGHIQALYKKFEYKDDDEYAELDQKRTLIRAVYIAILNYSLKFKYSYHRWQTIANFVMEKDEGIPKIHRLRVIHILEFDYNLLLSIKWRELVHHMEDNSLFNENQFGSRPG